MCTYCFSFFQDSKKLKVPCTNNGTHMGLPFAPHKFHSSCFPIVDHNEMDENYLIVTCTLHDQENVIEFHALIDCCATSYAFIAKDYICSYYLPLHLLTLSRNLIVIRGWHVTSGAIDHLACTNLGIGKQEDNISQFATNWGLHRLLPAISWLWRHDLFLCFVQNKVRFDSIYYLYHHVDDALHVLGMMQ
jgi:hypothetical protein